MEVVYTLTDVLNELATLVVPCTRVRMMTGVNKEIRKIILSNRPPEECHLLQGTHEDVEGTVAYWQLPENLTALYASEAVPFLEEVLYRHLLRYRQFGNLTNLNVSSIEPGQNPWKILTGKRVPALELFEVKHSLGGTTSLLSFCCDLPMSLKRLILIEAGITDLSLSEGLLKHLSGLQLIELDMSENYLAPRGVARVIGAVNKTSIQILRLGFTYANFRNTPHASMFPENIAEMKGLLELDISQMFLTAEMLKGVIDNTSTTIHTLKLEAVTFTESVETTTLQGLANLPELKRLVLDGLWTRLCCVLPVLPSGIQHLSVRELQRCANQITFGTLTQLVSLEMTNTPLSPFVAAQAMRSLPATLRHLSLPKVPDISVEPQPWDFRHLQSLQVLDVFGRRYESIVHSLP
jgi:hypothetical protein